MNKMKTRYRLTRRGIRGDRFYCVDTTTGKRTSFVCHFSRCYYSTDRCLFLFFISRLHSVALSLDQIAKFGTDASKTGGICQISDEVFRLLISENLFVQPRLSSTAVSLDDNVQLTTKRR